jgi:hypothetical protein
MVIDRQLCQQFLVPKHSNPDWTKGIPRQWIKPEYCTMLVSLQIFITCEGRYAITFLYHLRLLLHFEGGPKMNFPYFLWMSLSKMARGVRSTSKKIETSLYHHGLMKLLVVSELKKRGSSWKQFITRYFTLEEITTIPTKETPKSVGK